MAKISLGQLDLLALQQYLEIVVGFRKKDDRAIDVEYVGEFEHGTINDEDSPIETEKSRVMAHQIAMAALDDLGYPISYRIENGELVKNISDEVLERILSFAKDEGAIAIPERQTVLNSLMLDGVRADEFLKRVESDTILTDVNQATFNISEDIRNLKDELYQLKNQLVKVGTLKDSAVYNGFIDAFTETSPKNVVSSGIKVESVSGNVVVVDINVENVGNLRAGEIIVLESGNEEHKQYNIQKIAAINGNQIILDLDFEGSIVQPEANVGSVIQKSLGQNKNGKFLFGCETNGKVNVGENRYIVKDGTDRVKVFELDHPGHGFGTVVKIPSSLKNNVLSQVRVSLAVKGDPGRIEGEFWKYNEVNGSFEKTNYFTTGVTPMMASSWFNDFDLQLVNEMEVQPGERYLFILTAPSGGDEDNKWYIGGFNDDECLDDIHNDCYIKESNGGFNEVLWVSPEDKDMFLTLTTKEIKESNFRKLNYGLYTCEFDVHQSLANRIRVELCINQEGQFKVKDNNIVSLAVAKTNEIELETRGPKTFKDKVFGSGDYAVIGNEICKISSVANNNGNIIPSTDVYVKSNADVYRVGYEVQVIASNRVLEPTMYGAVQRYEDAEVYPLKFVGVVPGRDIIRPDKSSDRLLFEAEFYNQDDLDDIKLKSFDHIEVQVRWFGHVDGNIIDENEELEGAIFDISVSVDQAYTKSENEVE